MTWKQRHLLGIRHLEAREITAILDQAEAFAEISTREVKKVPALMGRTVINLFYEPSTRTRTSFEIAEKRLSADVYNFSSSSSSVVKGETLVDTILNLEAMRPDVIVVRHSCAGAPDLIRRNSNASVVNAGDGSCEHPTQALLDALTIRQRKGRIEGLRVAIIGDIAHSRVARSNIFLLSKMGASVAIAGPRTFLPRDIGTLGVDVQSRIEPAIDGADVVMMLRIQLERGGATSFPSLREYFRVFGLTRERLKLAKEDSIVMHPGPMNRGVEIESAVADGPYSVILEQVTNGVAVRMAVLYLIGGGGSVAAAS
jgi:aspartate carbamoyltransferase catalytic subunit